MDLFYFLFRESLMFSIPLLVVALGGLFSERSGVINIALEGIMIFGAFFGILFIYTAQNNNWMQGQLLFWISLIISGIIGGLFALLHAFASINMKADQTISELL